jgi:hypothetical protein
MLNFITSEVPLCYPLSLWQPPGPFGFHAVARPPLIRDLGASCGPVWKVKSDMAEERDNCETYFFKLHVDQDSDNGNPVEHVRQHTADYMYKMLMSGDDK